MKKAKVIAFLKEFLHCGIIWDLIIIILIILMFVDAVLLNDGVVKLQESTEVIEQQDADYAD